MPKLSPIIFSVSHTQTPPLCPSVLAAGEDATEAFFGLHRHEVLERPQYARLQIGVIEGEEPQILGGRMPGQITKVPYGEPTWLAAGYHSPYYQEVRNSAHALLRARSTAISSCVRNRATGSCRRRCAISSTLSSILMPRSASWTANVPHRTSWIRWRKYPYSAQRIARTEFHGRAVNLHAMRMGPGKHLQGLTLMGGIVKPEEVGLRIEKTTRSRRFLIIITSDGSSITSMS